MYYTDINRRYTETVAAYLANGYIINTRTMTGSQGDYAHIDLTDGTQVIRIMVDIIREYKDTFLDGLAIIVGRADSEVEPNSEYDRYTLWNHRLDVISKECFYEIGTDRRNRKFYGTCEEAIAAQQVKLQRYIAKNSSRQPENITAKVMEIAKRVIRREFGIKRICEADVAVRKHKGTYTVAYKNRVYQLH